MFSVGEFGAVRKENVMSTNSAVCSAVLTLVVFTEAPTTNPSLSMSAPFKGNAVVRHALSFDCGRAPT